MFNVNDYLITRTSVTDETENNPMIEVEVTIDKKKVKEDIQLFKTILQQLENIIGPYTIKVDSKKTKIKRKDKKND